MIVKAIKSDIIIRGDDILKILEKILPKDLEGCVLAITSKVVSICEGTLVRKDEVESKKILIKREADYYLDVDESENLGHTITIKNGILLPSAGIDESNSPDGDYILYPRDCIKSCEYIWMWLRGRVDNVGVMITDSHSVPMRRGVKGVALGWCGFNALNSYIGKPDIFGRILKCTAVNVLDSLAAAAVLEMGEADEKSPFALISEAKGVIFEKNIVSEDDKKKFFIRLEDDIYRKTFRCNKWISEKNLKQI